MMAVRPRARPAARGPSLREAIVLADGSGGADTIEFAAGAGGAFENRGTIRLVGGELEVTQALTMDGDVRTATARPT